MEGFVLMDGSNQLWGEGSHQIGVVTWGVRAPLLSACAVLEDRFSLHLTFAFP